ncbi:MAG TPA: Ppx/GppA phosphatase family protein [bacterium]|nr:Ppx/GppA phosphatase family protein [bacterium]HPN32546.1 Ppx/GppA phosphatase family protein [bacterium]
MRRIAGIDIGTNSLRVLIADIDSGGIFTPVYKSLKTTRIGKDLQKNGYILPEKIEENLRELIEICKLCAGYGCGEKIFFGTEGLRRAANSSELIDKFYEATGYKIRILSGREEAEYTFSGAVKLIDKKFLLENPGVLDIGGGSTEVCKGIFNRDDSGINYIEGISFPVGCVTMTEKFGTGNFPVDETALKDLKDYLKNEFAKIPLKFDRNKSRLIGVGGTITCLSAIKQGLKKYDEKFTHNSFISRDDIETILKRLLNTNIEEREKLPGLSDKRGDIIIAGISILTGIMDLFGFEEILISDYGILAGIILSL